MLELEDAETEIPLTDDPALRAEAEYEAFVEKNLPRNFAGHFVHGMLGMTGFRLFNAPTFLPAYLHMISGSTFIVGLGQALQQAGNAVSPVIGAAHVEHRQRVLPVSMLMGTLMRIPILVIAVAGWLLRGQPLVTTILVFLFLLGLAGGAQQVAFQSLLAKMIPIDKRGRLQALRNMMGGAISAALAFLAGRYLIQPNLFGNGYGVTFLAAFVLTSLGLSVLALVVREPIPPTVREKTRVRDRVREFPGLFRDDPAYAWFMLAQTLATAGRIASPFYILYAGKVMSLTGGNLGLVSLAFLGADTATNLIWGLIGDRNGFKLSFMLAVALWIAATLLLIAAPGFSHPLTTILMAFFGLGAAQSGFLMSSQTMVLEFGAREDLAMRLALSSTAQGAVAALGPLGGGVIAEFFGLKTLFYASSGALLVALALLAFKVEEPRLRRAELEPS